MSSSQRASGLKAMHGPRRPNPLTAGGSLACLAANAGTRWLRTRCRQPFLGAQTPRNSGGWLLAACHNMPANSLAPAKGGVAKALSPRAAAAAASTTGVLLQPWGYAVNTHQCRYLWMVSLRYNSGANSHFCGAHQPATRAGFHTTCCGAIVVVVALLIPSIGPLLIPSTDRRVCRGYADQLSYGVDGGPCEWNTQGCFCRVVQTRPMI